MIKKQQRKLLRKTYRAKHKNVEKAKQVKFIRYSVNPPLANKLIQDVWIAEVVNRQM